MKFLKHLWEIILAIFSSEKYEPDMPEEITPPPLPPKSPCELVYEVSVASLGVDISPKDMAPDTLGCAESVSHILKSVFPDFPVLVSTVDLANHLFKDPRFKGTLQYKPGVIIVSPTGTGNGTLRGHTGIFHEGSVIASNTSKTGLWEENYTLSSWVDYYRIKGGLKIYFFEPVGENSP